MARTVVLLKDGQKSVTPDGLSKRQMIHWDSFISPF